jgi:hypothetical protein
LRQRSSEKLKARLPLLLPRARVHSSTAATITITITPLQILQMIIGSYAIFHNLGFCTDSDGPAFAMFGSAMYLSYLVLFLVMFSGKINTFGSPAARPAKDTAKLK